ncbi:MAG: hypothetical protein PVI80_10615 [Anaerolineae bacterium]|jgi:hypothetical protein
MRVATFEGVVEQGRVRLIADTILPENTKVYVIVPSMQSEEMGRIMSPRLALREQAADFKMEIIEDSTDAAL